VGNGKYRSEKCKSQKSHNTKRILDVEAKEMNFIGI